MLFELVFEVATRLFGLVGLTLMKLSAWLPVVALTLTTGSRQVSGTNSRSVGLGARSLGIMHLRVPSGTSMPLGRRAHLRVQDGCGRREERENGGKDSQVEACVHMCVLIDVASKSGLKKNSQATRFFNDFRTNVEPYFECEDLGAKPARRTTKQSRVVLRRKLLLTIDAHSDGVKT